MQTALFAALFFTLGLYLTMRGGDAFVESASFIAGVTGIPKIIIGATIVSLCTTLPELLVSLLATLHGANDMATGNAIGSVLCNTGLILGLALLCMPGRQPLGEVRVKGGLLLVSIMLLGIFCTSGGLSTGEGVVLLALLAVFFWQSVRGSAQGKLPQAHRLVATPTEKAQNSLKFALGAAAVVLGANLMVDNGALLARFFGVPESVIGLTLVAVGTSLPELVTTLTAIRHREAAMSVGNIIGANLIDSTLVPAVCAFASRGALVTAPAVAFRDVPMALLLSAVALLPAMREGRFRRLQGVALLTIYGVYVLFLVI